MNTYNEEAPGGILYGITHTGDFEFASWADAWKALVTVGHPLQKHARWILSRRPFVQPTLMTRLRISFEFAPPLVEKVLPRWVGWGVVLVSGAVCWASIIALFF